MTEIGARSGAYADDLDMFVSLILLNSCLVFNAKFMPSVRKLASFLSELPLLLYSLFLIESIFKN